MNRTITKLFKFKTNCVLIYTSKRCYQKAVSLPECATLVVKIMDFDRLGKNELIGETTIDIEARYYSKHRAYCGLPKHFNK